MVTHNTTPTPEEMHILSMDEHVTDRLSLLEQVQDGHNWSARIVSNDAQKVESLHELRDRYARKQCSTVISTDQHGRTMLDIRHFGKETSIEEGFHALGVAQGTSHAISKVRSDVSEALKFVRGYMDTPMKFLSGFYTAGDIAFFATAWGEKVQGTAAWLKSSSAFCNYLQSFIFMKYGQDDSITHLQQIHDEIEKNLVKGIDDPRAVLQDASALERIHNPTLKQINDLLESHPAEAGVAIWNVGQLMVFTSGLMRLIDAKKKGENIHDAVTDIARATASIIGWCTLLVPQKHTEEKTPFFHNPLERIKEEVQEAPQRVSGTIALSASLISLNSNNLFQKAAEGMFIAGDVSMFFVEKGDYGQDSVGNPKALTEAIASFLEHMPMVFSPSTQKEFVRELSDYLVTRAEEKLSRAGKHVEEGLSEQVQAQVAAAMTQRPNRFETIATHTAILTHMFPTEERTTLTDALCDVIVNSAGVQIQREELIEQVQRQQILLGHTASQGDTRPSITNVTDAIAQLTFSLPTIASTDNALQLFDAVSPHLAPNPQKEALFQQGLVDYAAEEIQMNPKDLHRYAQQTRAPLQPDISLTR